MPVSVFERYDDLCERKIMMTENGLNRILGEGLCDKESVGAIDDVDDVTDLLVNENVIIHESRYVFVPVYIESDEHFVLYVVNHDEKSVTYYDSLHCGRVRGGQQIVKSVYGLAAMISGRNVESYRFESTARCSQQMNGYDCGLFVLEFIRRINAGESPVLENTDMWPVRREWFDFMTSNRDRNGMKLDEEVHEWAIPSSNATMNYDNRSSRELMRSQMLCIQGENWLTGLVIDEFVKACTKKYGVDKEVIVVPHIVVSSSPEMMRQPRVANVIEGLNGPWQKALIPVNVNNNHWTLAVITKGKLANGSDSTGVVYDPLKKDLTNVTLQQINNVRRELLKLPNIQVDGFSARSLINLQNDGHSCGVRICFVAERICRNVKEPAKQYELKLDCFPTNVYRGHIYNMIELYYTILDDEPGTAGLTVARRNIAPVAAQKPFVINDTEGMMEVPEITDVNEEQNESDLNVSFVRKNIDDFNLFESPKAPKRPSTTKAKRQTKVAKIDYPKKSADDDSMSVKSAVSNTASVMSDVSKKELKNARERYRRSLKNLSAEEKKLKMTEWNKEQKQQMLLDDESDAMPTVIKVSMSKEDLKKARDRYRYSLRNLSEEERKILMIDWNEKNTSSVRSEPKTKRSEPYKEYNRLRDKLSRSDDVDDKKFVKKQLVDEMREKVAREKREKLPRAAVCHELPAPHLLKDMVICKLCGALRFKEETRTTICCNGGKVIIEDFDTRMPVCMRAFRNRDHKEYKKRKELLRMYNSMLCFATASFKPRDNLPKGGPPVFVIQGEMSFNLCHLLPGRNSTPKFSQLYVVDDGEAARALKEAFDSKDTMNKSFDDLKFLFKVIKDNHVAARSLSTMYEKYLEAAATYEPQGKKFKVILSLKCKRDVPNAKALENKDVHPGRMNMPVATNQVASIYVSETGAVDYKELDKGTWIFDHPTGKPSQIRYFDANRFALAFPLLLPDGRQVIGYGKQYRLRNGNGVEEEKDEKVVIDDEEDAKMKGLEEDDSTRTFVSRAEFFRYVMNYFPNEQEKKKYEEFRLKSKENPNYDPYEALRDCTSDHWLWGTNRLSQAAVIDMFQTVDADKMEYFEKHFAEYRSEKQSVLWDIVQKQLPEGQKLGKVIHLPKAYSGSREDCTAKFQDGLAVAAAEGKPDLFITMTGNPEWPEVMRLLPEKDDPFDHIALVDRIFLLKLKELIDDLMKKEVFGPAKALTLSVEFQKRGLPHAHILLTLEEHIKAAEQVKNFICAEIPALPEKDDPDYERKQRYYDLVKKNMIHGPCENRDDLGCRETDETGRRWCSKNYPKDYNEDVYIANDRVEYQRRNDGKVIDFKNGRVATNRDVVPHNPFLLVKYGCHINVEVCISPLALAYIYKYLFKGNDKQYIEFKTIIQGEINAGERQPGEEPEVYAVYDERSEFKSMRYLSAHEASYRLLRFPLSISSHVVRRVAVHLPRDKQMVFKPGQDAATILKKEKKSFQESYFDLMNKEPSARHLTILDVMKEYTLSKKNEFNQRQRRAAKPMVIRLNPVIPKDMEKYCLRTLLIHTPGATGYEYLKTVTENGQTTVYGTFAEAAKARKLIDDQDEWDACLTEAAKFFFPKQMRYLFATILEHNSPLNPVFLWKKHKASMISPNPKGKRRTLEEREKWALAQIEKYLRQFGHTLKDFGFDPVDENLLVELDANEAVADTADQALKMEQYLNEQQREFTEMVLKALKTPRNQKAKRCFFLQGSGGVGKTYTYNYLINKVTSMGLKVAACATTGIAATLLARVNATTGWTGHSFFKLPLELKDGKLTSSLSASGTRIEEKRTQDLDLLILDEAPMMRKEYYEGIEAYLRDIAKPEHRHLPFGGVVVILGGDFKQFMPVEKTRHYSFDNAMRNTLIFSSLWKEFTRFELTQNVRVDKDQADFAEWLRKVGTGELNLPDETIKVPETIYRDNEDLIIQWIYPPEIRTNPREMGKRALVAVRNEDVNSLNAKVMDLLPGEYKDLLSADTPQNHEDEGYDSLPVTEEFLNTLTPNGMPPHRLRLKVGMTLMLLRNLDVRRGLCNGVRLELIAMNSFMIQCRHITDAGTGDCMIPRFKFNLNERNNPLKFTRLQFPVVPANCLTVNKSQGATLDRVGLILRHAAFAHGTNYVAFSRVRNWNSLRVTTNKNYPILGDGSRDIRIANPVAKDLLALAALDPAEVEKLL